MTDTNVRFDSNLTPGAACEALARAGFFVSADTIEIAARDERFAVTLPGGRMAWFPASVAGAERIAVERRVLRLIAACCSFCVPRLLYESDAFDVRALVPGRCDPGGLFRRCQADTALAQRIGESFGAILAEQHTRISHADVAGWLSHRPRWPQEPDRMRSRLHGVVQDRSVLHQIERALQRYEAVPIAEEDSVLIHGDVGFHNVALDPKTDAVNGIFDYDDAAWADCHHDFRSLLFDLGREDMLEAALRVYEPVTGRVLDRGRVYLYNAISAISHLALRADALPNDRPAGRTLAQDFLWVRSALRAVER